MGLFSKDRDRRQAPRYNKQLSIHIKNRSHRVSKRAKESAGSDNTSKEVAGKDISRGGLCFYSDIAYEPGTVLTVTIRISEVKDEAGRTPMYLMASSIPVRADVQVVWCKAGNEEGAYEIGVEFMDIYGDDHKILYRHLTD